MWSAASYLEAKGTYGQLLVLHEASVDLFHAADYLHVGGTYEQLRVLFDRGGGYLLLGAVKYLRDTMNFEEKGTYEEILDFHDDGVDLSGAAEFRVAYGTVAEIFKLHEAGVDLWDAAVYQEMSDSIDLVLKLHEAGVDLLAAACYLDAKGSTDEECIELHRAGVDLREAASWRLKTRCTHAEVLAKFSPGVAAGRKIPDPGIPGKADSVRGRNRLDR